MGSVKPKKIDYIKFGLADVTTGYHSKRGRKSDPERWIPVINMASAAGLAPHVSIKKPKAVRAKQVREAKTHSFGTNK